MTTWHPATKLLLIAALLAVPYLLLTRSESQPVTAPAAVPAGDGAPAAEVAAGEAPAPFVLPPLERFAAVVERPLFSPTRRMPAPTAPPAAEEEVPAADEEEAGASGPDEPELHFFGTVRRGDEVAALVTLAETGKVARLAPGDAVGEWRVLEVTRNRLVLGLGETQRSYAIFAPMQGAAAGTDGAEDE